MMTQTAAQNVAAYQQASITETENVRETEARALLNCAARLAKAQEPEAGMDFYLDAVRHNQQLWTIFQVTLCEADNPLPRDLKVTLLNLSRFVDKMSLRAQAEYTPSLLTSLIDINRHIAAGLSVKPESQMMPASVVPSSFSSQA